VNMAPTGCHREYGTERLLRNVGNEILYFSDRASLYNSGR
jgi:hypothetical protein